MRLDRLREGGADAIMVAHILRDADALAALFTNTGRRRFDLVGRARENRHRRARLRQPRCDLQVDPARSARHERCLARQKVVSKCAHDLLF